MTIFLEEYMRRLKKITTKKNSGSLFRNTCQKKEKQKKMNKTKKNFLKKKENSIFYSQL